jgi:SAM-dependent methyltransferase
MPDATLQHSRGRVFDRVAGSYDRHRPSYPEELIERAWDLAGLRAGAEVLEIGCGTGQLTRALLDRGLRVTAIEPGEQLLRLARENLTPGAEIEFLNTRFEDAALAQGRFQAVFCASSIHWIDPALSWKRAADALAPEGTLALLQYFPGDEERSVADQRAVLDVIAAIAPEVAARWPRYGDAEATLAGAHERRANISEVWSWLGSYDVARPYAAELFGEAEIVVLPQAMEHTADELNALLGTTSFWSLLSGRQRDALEGETRLLEQRLGRPIRSSALACLVTAQRARA